MDQLRRDLRDAGTRADIMAHELQSQTTSLSKLEEELRRSTATCQQLRDQSERVKSDYEAVIEKLQQELRDSGMRMAKLESESRASSLQVSEVTRREERRVTSLNTEVEQLKQSISLLETDRDALNVSLKDATAPVSFAQNANSELKRELTSLRAQVEDKDRSITVTLASTQQRAEDEAARSKQIEVDLREAKSSLETMMASLNEKEIAFKTLQEDHRRSTAQLQSLRDASQQSKTETDSLIDGFHRELNELGEKCSKLESQARASTLQVSEITRREERQVASLRADLEQAQNLISKAEETMVKTAASGARFGPMGTSGAILGHIKAIQSSAERLLKAFEPFSVDAICCVAG